MSKNRNRVKRDGNNTVSQGDVFYVDFDKLGCIGSEESGIRPVVVVSSSTVGYFSPIIIVCPITSKDKKSLPTHHFLSRDKYRFLLRKDNIVLTENVRAISKDRLIGKKVGTINEKDVCDIIVRLNNNFVLTRE